MKSSRWADQGGEARGFPVRPLLLSLALHGLALAAWLEQLPSAAREQPPARLQARLQAVPLPGAVASAPVPHALPDHPVPRHAPASVARASAVLPPPSFSAPAPARPRDAEEVAEAGGQAVVREPTGAATVAVPTAPRVDTGPDAGGLRQYRLALASEARRWRNYPEVARRGELTGTAEVRVDVEGGAARRTEISRSSGHAALDDAALDILRRAAARAELPASLRGQSFAVLLPVVFEVGD